MSRSTKRSVCVAIVDDSPVYRQGIARAITRDERLELVGEASEGNSALELVRSTRPDVALVDISMPGLDGIEVCAAIVSDPALADTRVVLITASLDEATLERTRQAGAAACIDKGLPRSEICALLVQYGI